MTVTNGPLTVGQVLEQLQNVAPETPFLVYDEKESRYQELCQLDLLTYETEKREEILPPTKKKNEPFLEEGQRVVLLTSHTIEA